MDLLHWVIGSVASTIVITLLVWLIRNWFESLKVQLKEAIATITASIERLTGEINRLFERSEADRLERMNCQLNAQRTYATKKELAEIAARVSDIERSGRHLQ